MIFVTLLVVTIVLGFLTLLPLSRFEYWWVRCLDFPRLQLSVLLFCLLFLDVLLLEWSQVTSWVIIVAGLFCFSYQAWWIVKYTPFYPVEVVAAVKGDERRTISIMTANVLMTNHNANALIAMVKDYNPDIFVTLESDKWWQERLDEIEQDYPHTIKCPLDNLYGMHVYSRLPLLEKKIEYLVEFDKPSMHALVSLLSGEKIRIHFLHPAPPSPTENEQSSERDAELLVVAKSVADTEDAVIVTGDLNDVAWSETTRMFRKISGLLDPRVGRGMFNTFHAQYWFLRWPLDHLFHSKHFTLSDIRRLPKFGSDHFALFTKLVYDRRRGANQKGLEANGDDLDWATEKTQAEGVTKSDVPEPGRKSE